MHDLIGFLERQWQFEHSDVVSLNYLTPKSWILPSFFHTLSNANPAEVVKELDSILTQFVEDQRYDEIVFLGHSTGATLSRKLYLLSNPFA